MSDLAVSILIPCFNEAGRIGKTVPAVLSYLDEAGIAAELILIDDGSLDETWSLLEEFGDRYSSVQPVRLQKNRGKGGALAAGVAAARAPVVLFFDADLSYQLENIGRALERITGGAQVVIGARDLSEGAGGYSLVRQAASQVFNVLVDVLLRLEIPDTQCGFKAFDAAIARELFSVLTIERFGFDVEILFLARRWNLRVERMPIEMIHQTGSSVRLMRDSLRMFLDIGRIWINAKLGRYPLHWPQNGGMQANAT